MFDDLPSIPESPEQMAARVVLAALKWVSKDYGMEHEYLTSFLEDWQKSKDAGHAHWHACCEWDL